MTRRCIYLLAAFMGTVSSICAEEVFLKGGDISILQAIEDRGGVYKQDGDPRDPLLIFREHGMNTMRLRIFHSPTGEPPLVNDLEYTKQLGRRIKDAGLLLLLDFHYSDSWADPGKQTLPKVWEALDFDALTQAVYEYTRDAIAAMTAAGALPDIVQVGNEIGPGMLWPHGRVGGKENDTPENWHRLAVLLKAGIRGVREGAGTGPTPRIMIHIECGGDVPKTLRFFEHMEAEGVPFDMIGLSYYPWWHSKGQGYAPLREDLASAIARFGKDVVVVETAYPWYPNCDAPDKIMHRNELMPLVPGIPASKDGQETFLRGLIETVRSAPEGRGKGVIYWAPEYIPAPQLDPGRNHLSLFDAEGNALPGMNAFRE